MTRPPTQAAAEAFADDWIAAWNAHDLERILAHYSDDFTMSSPVIVNMTGEASGTLVGKTAVAGYWAKALEHYPELRFTKRNVLVGATSVTIIYDGVRGLSAEMFEFDETGHVCRAMAHYVED